MLRRLLAASGVLLVFCVVVAAPASAHPLGNFTVNRYARVEVSGSIARIYYVLDEAEIPTFQDRDALSADRAEFIRERRESIQRGLTLTFDGARAPLTAAATNLTLPPGQGGLDTLRLAIRFEARVPAHDASSSVRVTFADENEPDRVGWREIIVVGLGGAVVKGSTAPSHDLSDELRQYPADLLQAPLDLHRAEFTFTPGTQVEPAAIASPASAPTRSGSGFANLITRQSVTPLALAGMLGLALLFGAAHALAPGHGKTVMAAYLVGTRGRPIDAVLLGVIVSAMHTGSVLALALVLYQVNRSAEVDRVYPVLTIASGLLVIGLGVYLAVTRSRQTRRGAAAEPAQVGGPVAAPVRNLVTVSAAPHDHADGHAPEFEHVPLPDHTHSHDHFERHEHAHGHSPGHEHGPGSHTHELPADVAPFSRRGLIVLATAGGLLPSPSAVLVLLGAFAAGRAGLGFGLVGAFSIGLAVTLTAVGLALVFGRSAIERRGFHRGRLSRWLPVGSAIAIVVVGSIVTVQGIGRL